MLLEAFTTMFKNHHLSRYAGYASAAAALFCPFAAVYIIRAKFPDTWILYIGNILFGLTVCFFIFHYNKKRREGASSIKMLTAGHIVTVMGILISCVVCALLLLIFLRHGLQRAPGQVVSNPRDLIFIVFMNTIVGNISTGSFASILFPFTITKKQEGQAEPEDSVV